MERTETVIGKRYSLELMFEEVKVSSLLCKQEHVLARFVSCLHQCAAAHRLQSAVAPITWGVCPPERSLDPAELSCGGAPDEVSWNNIKHDLGS